MSKDRFSDQANAYALYRPVYPKALFEYIVSFVKEKDLAWDCATGNGQSALPLSNYFKKVVASDISQKQLDHAPVKDNIEYVKCSAEETPFSENYFDLITISQAYHWMNWSKFHAEAKRVGKNECVVAVWMYDLISSEEEKINSLIRHFYKNITGPYWDAERKHVDNTYSSVQFDFAPLPVKNFSIETEFTLQQLLGYFSTWSATQNFIKAKGYAPVDEIKSEFFALWNDEQSKHFYFPLVLKLGKIIK
jgi:ubiquinone/menaquinone biosynthesis C-methylase UbiE